MVAAFNLSSRDSFCPTTLHFQKKVLLLLITLCHHDQRGVVEETGAKSSRMAGLGEWRLMARARPLHVTNTSFAHHQRSRITRTQLPDDQRASADEETGRRLSANVLVCYTAYLPKTSCCIIMIQLFTMTSLMFLSLQHHEAAEDNYDGRMRAD